MNRTIKFVFTLKSISQGIVLFGLCTKDGIDKSENYL